VKDRSNKTNLSRSSVTPSSGVHSNIMTPGKPSEEEALLRDSGIEKTVSDSHQPDAGTSNLRSNQMAVASLSGFIDSHILQS